MKTEIPRLENGEIDYSKVDVHNDFRLFPKMFENPQDIWDFIKKEKVKVPFLKLFLQRAKDLKLGWTQCETDFYLNDLFDYIYDVFRIPVEYTTKETKNWLQYIEQIIIHEGAKGVEKKAFDNKFFLYHSMGCRKRLMKFIKQKGKTSSFNDYPEINFHVFDLGYACANGVDSFFIKSDSCAGQPFEYNKEYYMLVSILEKRVHIGGCDDMSWTLFCKNDEEIEDFVEYLKCAAPIWNFNYPKLIHPKLEFTN